jgi:zinc protease
MRTLDNEPYIDAMWAIITGIDAEHAIKCIDNDSVTQPFIIQRAINFTNVDQNLFETCFTFSDRKKGCWFGKNCGLDDESGEEKDEGEEFLQPSAQIFTDKFNELEPDLLVTSGHGTEQSVEMPWSTGKLEVEEHGLVPLDEDSKPIAPIIESSANPKIFLPIANCLVGHCTGPQCMVTTFLGRMGVRQMCGYTVRTWFGRAGWGTFDLWKSVPGRLTLSDAYFLHQARLTYDLKSINPRLLNFKLDLNDDDPGYETVVEQLDQQYHLDKDNLDEKILQEIHGLCYDRDTFVFYGDPAFLAKLDETKNEKFLTTKFLRTGKTTHQFIIEYKDLETAQNFQLPIGSLFTNRIENYNIINGFEYVPILSDNFLILLKPTPRDKESTIIKIDFRGTIIQ